MIVKNLGGGCPRCEKLEQMAREAAKELGIERIPQGQKHE